MRFIFKGLGQVSIDRSSGSAAQAALTAGARVLQEGKWLGIYPEGTRSPDGRLYRGKTGVARLVLETKAPVIPVAMVNTEKILPIGASFPRIKRAGICFGKPLNFSRYEGFTGDRLVERAITDEITAAIRDMSKQEYVDVYASAVKTGKVRPRPVANKDME